MRKAMPIFRIVAVTSLALVLSSGLAEAKKKKPAAIDCTNTEEQAACTASADVASKSTDDAPTPPETVPAKSAAKQTASAATTDDSEDVDTSGWYIGTQPDQPYDIPLVDRSKMDAKFERQEVAFDGKQPVGSIVVDIDRKFLYYVTSEGRAMRYGIGVGRLGFSWNGNAIVGRKGVWPHWTPTETMRKVLPNLPVGMDGGVDSPLGARAMYLYQDGHDIMFRIHGTNEPWSIGEQVSSGCVRLLNEDVVDLYDRVKVGTPVFVHNSKHGNALKLTNDDSNG